MQLPHDGDQQAVRAQVHLDVAAAAVVVVGPGRANCTQIHSQLGRQLGPIAVCDLLFRRRLAQDDIRLDDGLPASRLGAAGLLCHPLGQLAHVLDHGEGAVALVHADGRRHERRQNDVHDPRERGSTVVGVRRVCPVVGRVVADGQSPHSVVDVEELLQQFRNARRVNDIQLPEDRVGVKAERCCFSENSCLRDSLHVRLVSEITTQGVDLGGFGLTLPREHANSDLVPGEERLQYVLRHQRASGQSVPTSGENEIDGVRGCSVAVAQRHEDGHHLNRRLAKGAHLHIERGMGCSGFGVQNGSVVAQGEHNVVKR
mmetsp:Transcript_1967/g.7103  ORF Transcript_1967/g.7103 Transcript_1967/m.7103 type:complete len:315 (+) Transcript_1967:264-1208(+)